MIGPLNSPPPAVVPARPEILSVPPAVHGALDYAELQDLGLDPGQVLDFSVNGNPFGASPQVRRALGEVPLERYPDREAWALRRALGRRLGLSPDELVVGNGSAELLWLVASAFLQPGDRVVTIGPTFGEYARVAALMGAAVHSWTARAALGFWVMPDEVEILLRQAEPRLVFLCNPNNPTGVPLPVEALSGWTARHPHTLFVADEAYAFFAPGFRSALTTRAPNVLVLRSMTKDYALAGLRLGYAAGPRPVVTAISRTRPAWNVNAFAQAAGLAALADEAHQQACLGALLAAKATLVADLEKVGLAPLPSAVHFFLVQVGDAAAFRRALLRQGILVRDCTSFGLPEYVRIATRRPEENARLIGAVADVQLPVVEHAEAGRL
jgi:histidinol-phosphate aminotransferase